MRYEFSVEDFTNSDCDFCLKAYKPHHVQLALDGGYQICPACIRKGPKVAAAALERQCSDVKSFAKWWSTDDKRDIRGLVEDSLEMVKRMRKADSFLDFPGGAVAVAIATVKLTDIRRGYHRKVA